MTITEFLSKLDREIPLDLAMPDDPVGLQVMAEDRAITTVGVAYEVNERIVDIASKAGVELIIAFHPLIYPSLKKITGSNRVERTVVDLIDRRIGLYILHTAFDAHPEGTSHLLANALGCVEIVPLTSHSRIENAGMGAVGTLTPSLTLQKLADRLKEVCNAPVVRISGGSEDEGSENIGRIAILGGSGMSFYEAAVASGADAFITADVRYHAFHAANDSLPILDPGHAESEAFVVAGIAKLVEKVAKEIAEDIDVLPITVPTNPVRYIV